MENRAVFASAWTLGNYYVQHYCDAGPLHCNSDMIH